MARGKHCIGLDIGSSSVKICELSSRRDRLQLETFDWESLPEETIVDGALMNPTVVADVISDLIERNGISRKETAIGVAGNTVIIKKITLPAMTEEELEESIQWEAEQHIPFDIDDVYVGYEMLRHRTEQGQMDVVLVAAKKELIADYEDVCHRCDLKPMVADVDSFAVQNMYEANYGFGPAETVNLLDLGNSVVSMNVVRDGITTFTRDLSVGGATITEEIQQRLNITYQEAEIYKRGGTPEDAGADEVVPSEVESIIQDTAQDIASQLKRSLDFYRDSAADSQVDKIVVTGGTAALPSLRRIIESTTGIETQLANPFREIDCEDSKFPPDRREEWAPIAGVSVGLALRRTDER